MSISLTLEQQHIFFERMGVNVELRCELCYEIEEIPMSVIHVMAVETGDYTLPIQEFKRMAVAFTDAGWRVLPHPGKLNDFHKRSRKDWLEEMELKEKELRWPKPGEPVVVCKLCAKILEN